jgi:hypothetical protein
MLKPTGPHAPAVYWRRRLVLLGALFVVLLVGYAMFGSSGGGRSSAAQPHGALSATAPAPHSTPTASAVHSSPSKTATAANPKHPKHTVAPPKPCTPAQVHVAAATGATNYHTGDQPVLILQVVDVGTVPCVQTLADSAVELRVYNGESRIWGSHDCKIAPGALDRTLLVGQPVRVSLTWSGLSSQAGCTGPRQHVGAGTYTVYALLSGRLGTAAQFSIT